jgi:hypothetical protein
MTLLEIKQSPLFTDQGRATCGMLRQHLLMLQRKYMRSTPTSDLTEIGRRALIYSEVIDAVEELMNAAPKVEVAQRKRLHRQGAERPATPPKPKKR